MFVIPLLFFATVQIPPIDYFEAGKLFANEQRTMTSIDIKKQLKDKIEQVKRDNQYPNDETNAKIYAKTKQCLINPNVASGIQTFLYVFVSFSMPEEAWITLSKDVQKVGGILVLRGLPGNSFKNLAEKMRGLRKKGVHATVQIDPRLFTKYSIEKTPCFVATDGKNFDKLSGNVSLAFALDKMEIGSAKTLRKLL